MKEIEISKCKKCLNLSENAERLMIKRNQLKYNANVTYKSFIIFS